MNKYKKNRYLLFFSFLAFATKDVCAASGLRQLGMHVRKAGAELATNKKSLAKAGLGWGAFTGTYYAGTKSLADLNPEVTPKQPLSDKIIADTGLDKNRITYISPTVFNAQGDGTRRWLTNGKGFWGNLISLASPSTVYMGNDGKLRVPEATANQLAKGEGISEFLETVKDQEYRYNSSFDYKTYAECALNTALWTPIFMLSPIVNTLKSAKIIAELGWTSGLNRIIRAVRDKKGHQIAIELSK